MPENKDDSNQGIMPNTDNAPSSHSPSRPVEQEDQGFDIQNGDESDQVDAHFNNLALMAPEGANNPDPQERNEDQTDNVDVDW